MSTNFFPETPNVVNADLILPDSNKKTRPNQASSSHSVLKKIDEHISIDVQPQKNTQSQLKSFAVDEAKTKDSTRKFKKKPVLYKTIQLQQYIRPSTVAQQSLIQLVSMDVDIFSNFEKGE